MQTSKITKLLVGTTALLMMTTLHARALWTFQPMPAGSNIVDVPANGAKTVTYRVTNASSRLHTLMLESIPGIIQIPGGAGVCSFPSFTLPTKGSFCDLVLQITGNQFKGNPSPAPKLCQQGPDGTPSPSQCYNPSLADSLKITITNTLTIGESYGGGTVACLGGAPYLHLVAATVDNTSGAEWGPPTQQMNVNTSIIDGLSNTIQFLAAAVGLGLEPGQIAAYAPGNCGAYTGGGFTDWYLPSRDQLDCLYANRVAIGGFDQQISYWSSTEINPNQASAKNFATGNNFAAAKDSVVNGGRCVRDILA